MYRAQLEEGDALVRKLRARVAEAEGKALLQKVSVGFSSLDHFG